MTIYTCNKCGKIFELKGDYTRHINKKFSCKKVITNEEITKLRDKTIKIGCNSTLL
jgi:uncharacterized C2H2 Zn-finger protein